MILVLSIFRRYNGAKHRGFRYFLIILSFTKVFYNAFDTEAININSLNKTIQVLLSYNYIS